MAYVAPSTVTTLQTYTSSAHNIIVNDIIDHETLVGGLRSQPTSWTPDFVGAWAKGNSTTEGRYYKLGKLVIYWGKITLGSTATKSGNMGLTLPVAQAQYTDYRLFSPMHSFVLEQTGTNVFYGFGGDPASDGASNIFPNVLSVGGSYAALSYVAPTVPFTWSTGHNIMYSGMYESVS